MEQKMVDLVTLSLRVQGKTRSKHENGLNNAIYEMKKIPICIPQEHLKNGRTSVVARDTHSSHIHQSTTMSR